MTQLGRESVRTKALARWADQKFRSSMIAKFKAYYQTNPKSPFPESFLLQRAKQRLFKYVSVSSNGCWLWTGNLKDGYGVTSLADKCILAHRLAWRAFVGSIPSDKGVLHKCPGGSNRACCNPSHLYLGTSLDNAKDRVREGRSACGSRHGSKTHPEKVLRGAVHPRKLHPENFSRGESHLWAKISEQDVRIIRRLRRHGFPLKKVSRLFHISQSSVSAIATKACWKHV